MAPTEYRIESNHPVSNRFVPHSDVRGAYPDWSQAVAMAVKTAPNAFGDEVRVVHVPSGEIVFRIAADDDVRGPSRFMDFDPE
jgi:hypothetical protein